jgi:outer membrane lipoprotein-sorting protein
MLEKPRRPLDSAVFDSHTRTMTFRFRPMTFRSRRTFLAGAGAAALAGVSTGSVFAQATNPDVAAVERYFNGLRTLQARFVQSNPGGTVVQGTLSVRRPGRMRFEYDPPSQLKIVADGSQVTMWDIANRDFGQWPIGWTAASFLVKEPMVLQGGDLTVEKVERADGMLQLTLVQTRKPQEGKVIVRLAENPMALRGWTIIDNRGQRVDVSLNGVQTGLQLADSLFKFDGPDASIIRRGNR